MVSDVCVSLREVENTASCLKLAGDDGWSHCSAYNNSCQAPGWACDPGPLTVAGGGDGNGSRDSQLPGSALTFPPCHLGPNSLWQKVWFFPPCGFRNQCLWHLKEGNFILVLCWFTATWLFPLSVLHEETKVSNFDHFFFSVSQMWNSLICTTESHQKTFKN